MSAYAGEFKSQRQFKLSGRRKSGYDFKLIRAVAQSGSALPWGGRGPGFKSRRPDELKTVKTVLADAVREVGINPIFQVATEEWNS